MVDTGCDARKVFVNLPVGVLDILPKPIRSDMLTYFENDSVWQAPNSMGGVSTLSAASPEFLEVKVSDVSLLQVKRLPYKGGCVFMTVYTVGIGGGAPDSQLRFYSSTMKDLPLKKFIRMPRIADFLNLAGHHGKKLSELEQVVAFPTYEFSTSASSNDLSGELTVGEYMTEEDYAEIKPYLRPGGVTYTWTGSGYRMKK